MLALGQVNQNLSSLCILQPLALADVSGDFVFAPIRDQVRIALRLAKSPFIRGTTQEKESSVAATTITQAP
jgi:hypothetical protein